MRVQCTPFGIHPNGSEIFCYHFQTLSGMQVSIINLGGIVVSIRLPGHNGSSDEITAGFPNLQPYLKSHPHFGAIIGRFANRISGANYSIGDNSYQLTINDAPNQLHGGPGGFHTKVWDHQLTSHENHAELRMDYLSPHLEEGHPGDLRATVIYTIFDHNVLDISFRANTNRNTHVNLTSHMYFNLGGFKQTVHDHDLWLGTTHVLENGRFQIPTGAVLPCKSSRFDFSSPRNLGKALKDIEGGLDHCFAWTNETETLRPAARLTHPPSGRSLTLLATQPGLQVYSGNSLDGSFTGHDGISYGPQSAICLEPQRFPDSPNQPGFPSTLLYPGAIYKAHSRWVFGA